MDAYSVQEYVEYIQVILLYTEHPKYAVRLAFHTVFF